MYDNIRKIHILSEYAGNDLESTLVLSINTLLCKPMNPIFLSKK